MCNFHTLYKLSYACFCKSLKELLVYCIVSVFLTPSLYANYTYISRIDFAKNGERAIRVYCTLICYHRVQLNANYTWNFVYANDFSKEVERVPRVSW